MYSFLVYCAECRRLWYSKKQIIAIAAVIAALFSLTALLFFTDEVIPFNEYICIDERTYPHEGHQNICYMFYLIETSMYGLFAAAILVISKMFLSDYKMGAFKNILASKVKKTDIFEGKLIFCIVLMIIISAIVVIYAYCFGAQDTRVPMSIFRDSFRKIAAMDVFWAQAMGIFASMLVLSAVTMLTGIIFRSAVIGAAGAVAYYMSVLITYLSLSEGSASVVAKYLPVINLQTLWVGGFTNDYFSALYYCAAFAAVIFFISAMVFKRQDIR